MATVNAGWMTGYWLWLVGRIMNIFYMIVLCACAANECYIVEHLQASKLYYFYKHTVLMINDRYAGVMRSRCIN